MKQKINRRNVSRETLQCARDLYDLNRAALEEYQSELLWWNSRVNLVSRDVSRETIREHVVHSLIPSVLSLFRGIDSWTDAGTGGGLPGIPLAIVEPEKAWVLNDIVHKKVMAVRQMVNKLEIPNVSSRAGSVSDLNIVRGSGIVTKHAFPAVRLLQMVGGEPWKRLIMYKGSSEAADEIRDLSLAVRCTIYSFDFGKNESFFEGKAILSIENESDQARQD